MAVCLFGMGLLRVCILSSTFTISFTFFFFFLASMNNNGTIHAHGFTAQGTKCTIHSTYNHFIKKNILKMGTTALFTHLKVMLLQYFQLSVFSKLSCIWADHTYYENVTIDYMFFIFWTHMSNFVIIGYYLQYDA